MEEKKRVNPFEGLKRRRMPGMHMMTAEVAGVCLQEALASHFFMMLHDKVNHNCLIKKALEEQKAEIQAVAREAKTAEGGTLACVFGLMGSSGLVNEEWSYLGDNDAYIFFLLASTAIEQTQRWIASGLETPYRIPLGDLVVRPEWAKAHSWGHGTQDEEMRTWLEQIRQEIAAADQQ